ncbi:TPA: 50S ribosomal protein L37ae [Candidatus Woesearchaeota archaeon]|nr:50S ribosomal protein L37ae [Candidatus Woesearchaeota archaeon]
MTTTKRFGARYGRKTRAKFALVEAPMRTRQKCPHCNKMGVKRVALGIWECRKCHVSMTGKAYSLQ